MPCRFDLFVSKLGLEKKAKPARIPVDRNHRLGRPAGPGRIAKPDRDRAESYERQRRRAN